MNISDFLIRALVKTIEDRLLLMGEPDLGRNCLVMVGNNKLYLWQEQIKVNISDFIIRALVNTIDVHIQTGYS